jgi:hypothetical protein
MLFPMEIRRARPAVWAVSSQRRHLPSNGLRSTRYINGGVIHLGAYFLVSAATGGHARTEQMGRNRSGRDWFRRERARVPSSSSFFVDRDEVRSLLFPLVLPWAARRHACLKWARPGAVLKLRTCAAPRRVCSEGAPSDAARKVRREEARLPFGPKWGTSFRRRLAVNWCLAHPFVSRFGCIEQLRRGTCLTRAARDPRTRNQRAASGIAARSEHRRGCTTPARPRDCSFRLQSPR